MNLIDKQHVVIVQIGQECSEVPRPREYWARRDSKSDAELCRHDSSKRRLAKSRRSSKQEMVDRLAALASCFKNNVEMLNHLWLTDELRKIFGPK